MDSASDAGQAEVENLYLAVTGQEDVVGLQVAMDDALLMRGRKASRDELPISQALRMGKRSLLSRSPSVSPASNSITT